MAAAANACIMVRYVAVVMSVMLTRLELEITGELILEYERSGYGTAISAN